MKKQSVRIESTNCCFKRKNLTSLPFLNAMIGGKIEHLDISQNFLHHLQQFKGIKFSRLRTLYLNNNFLTSISLSSLLQCEFPALQKLSLFGNQIDQISTLSKIKFPSLTELKLGFKNNGNQLNQKSLSALFANDQHFPSLAQLTLDYNKIGDISFLGCKCLQNLTLIYLSGNQILYVDPSILNRVEKLKVVSLKNNYLSSIRFIKRLYLPHLEYLNLSDNFISELQGISEGQIKELTRIHLEGNLINDSALLVKCQWPQGSQINIFNISSIFNVKVSIMIKEKFLMMD